MNYSLLDVIRAAIESNVSSFSCKFVKKEGEDPLTRVETQFHNPDDCQEFEDWVNNYPWCLCYNKRHDNTQLTAAFNPDFQL